MLAENTAEVKRELAMRMIEEGSNSLKKIAVFTGLSIDSVNQLAAEVKK